MKHIKLIFLFVAVIGAFVLGFLLNTPDVPSSLADATLEDSVYVDESNSIRHDELEAVNSSSQAGTPPAPTGEENTKEDQPMHTRSRADEIKKILQKDGLTFAEVYWLAQSHPDETLVQRYKRVVDAITGKKMHSIQSEDLKALTKYQKYAITGITYGQTVTENEVGKTVKYNKNQKIVIRGLLKNKAFLSFKEMPVFHKTIWEEVKDKR